jgi:hypothetical protein
MNILRLIEDDERNPSPNQPLLPHIRAQKYFHRPLRIIQERNQPLLPELLRVGFLPLYSSLVFRVVVVIIIVVIHTYTGFSMVGAGTAVSLARDLVGVGGGGAGADLDIDVSGILVWGVVSRFIAVPFIVVRVREGLAEDWRCDEEAYVDSVLGGTIINCFLGKR